MKSQVIVNPDKGAVVVILKNRKYQGKGIAKCNASHNDVFVESVGIELAEQRALRAMEQDRRRTYAKKAKMHMANAAHYQGLIDNTANSIAEIDARIDEILKSVN